MWGTKRVAKGSWTSLSEFGIRGGLGLCIAEWAGEIVDIETSLEAIESKLWLVGRGVRLGNWFEWEEMSAIIGIKEVRKEIELEENWRRKIHSIVLWYMSSYIRRLIYIEVSTHNPKIEIT